MYTFAGQIIFSQVNFQETFLLLEREKKTYWWSWFLIRNLNFPQNSLNFGTIKIHLFVKHDSLLIFQSKDLYHCLINYPINLVNKCYYLKQGLFKLLQILWKEINICICLNFLGLDIRWQWYEEKFFFFILKGEKFF